MPERDADMKRKTGLIIVFAAFLILPTVLYGAAYGHIDHENREKREYASFPVLSKENYGELPEELEAYYNDRVPFKNQFKAIRTAIDTKLQRYESVYAWIRMTPMVLRGEDGWFFYMPSVPGEDAVDDYLGFNRYTQEEMAQYAEKIQQLSDYYAEQGITFVFLIAPGKENIYTEFLPDSYPSRGETTRFEEFAAYLHEHNPSVHVIYPRECMRDMQDVCELYFKKDSHWNHAGAYLAAKSLMDPISEEPMPELTEAEPMVAEVRNGGDLMDFLGITGEEADDEVIRLNNLAPEVTVTQIEGGHSVSDAPDQRKCLILGDSFSPVLYSVMKHILGEVRIINGTGECKEILEKEDFHPDILIWEVAERYGNRMDWPDVLMGINDQEQESEGF